MTSSRWRGWAWGCVLGVGCGDASPAVPSGETGTGGSADAAPSSSALTGDGSTTAPTGNDSTTDHSTTDRSSTDRSSTDGGPRDETTGVDSTGVTDSAETTDGGEDTGPSNAVCPPPGPDEVGVVDEAALVDSDRIVVSRSGTVIENVHVHGDIEIVDGASDVTIRNFRITADGYWGIFIRDGSNIVIEDGEIDGLDSLGDAIRGDSYTARRLYIHDIGGDAFKADGDTLVECNYVTDIGQAPGAHGDGIQMMGAGDITIRRNNFELTSGTLTACIFPFGTDPVSGPVWVEENRLNGGAYTVYCHDNLHMTNNVFGDAYAYGPVTNECGTWEGNVWEGTGESVPN